MSLKTIILLQILCGEIVSKSTTKLLMSWCGGTATSLLGIQCVKQWNSQTNHCTDGAERKQKHVHTRQFAKHDKTEKHAIATQAVALSEAAACKEVLLPTTLHRSMLHLPKLSHSSANKAMASKKMAPRPSD